MYGSSGEGDGGGGTYKHMEVVVKEMVEVEIYRCKEEEVEIYSNVRDKTLLEEVVTYNKIRERKNALVAVVVTYSEGTCNSMVGFSLVLAMVETCNSMVSVPYALVVVDDSHALVVEATCNSMVSASHTLVVEEIYTCKLHVFVVGVETYSSMKDG
ncbi:hypothetical protein Pint_31116 [Pistacia integerrima]|uniref:Uncharacterized protein n=1 Tax=Pistacia integerrima TaxID=434235 RepID=A0ACC0XPH8_9ROSI|nr:hypothetical protein Pint_31116 [Pistacia integerrima]